MADLPDTFCDVSPLLWSRLAKLDLGIDMDNDIDKSGQGTFYIDVTLEFSWSEPDEECILERWNVELRFVQVFLPRDLLLDESWGRLMLIDVLSAMKVPARDHQFITEKLLLCARSMARDYPDGHVGILPMGAMIQCCLDDVKDLDAPSMFGSIRDKYTVRGLRKVKIEGEAGTCSICLDDIPSRSVAASLPCSHVYHRHCVFTWIIQSGTCPLCRSKT